MNNRSLKVMLVAVSAAMMTVAWFSCSSSGGPVVCDAASCMGCCDSSGTCQQSNIPHCGINGAACTACMGVQQCHSGTCVDVAAMGGGSGSTGGGTASSGGGSGSTGGGTGSTGGGTGSTGGGTGSTGGGTGGPTLCTNPDAGPDIYAGCDTWEDHTDAGDTRIVVFGTNFLATPMCMEIKSGQSVTFESTDSTHPGEQRCGPVDDVIYFDGGVTKAIQFSTTGVYGYHCFYHDFKGAIKVDP